MSETVMANPTKLITDNLAIWTEAHTTKSSAGRGTSSKLNLHGIKKLRELILELAVRGKLVPQDPNDEPASVLLGRIAAEKARLAAEGKIKKQRPMPPINDDEKPFELPVGWEWCRLGDITQINPRNDVADDIEASFVPMPLITTEYDGRHNQEAKLWGEIKKGYTHFSDGDIAIAKITPCFENSKAAIFSGLSNGVGAGTTELHVARPYGDTFNPYFVLLYLKAPQFLLVGETKMTGSAGQKRVPKDFFTGNPLPLPPEAEQHRIVAKVKELMALCDQLEQQQTDTIATHQTLVETLLTTLTRSTTPAETAKNWARIAEHFDTLFTTEHSIDQLKQTIVQLAVMGKLVPQDPNDEPAAVLLERIAAEKARLVAEKKIKKQKPLPPVSDDEKPFALPVGWTFIRFGDVYEMLYGDNLPQQKRSNTGEYPVYGSNGIVGTHNEAVILQPCIIIGRKGSAGALNLCKQFGCWVTDVAYSVVPPKSVDLEYSFLMFHTLGLDSLGKGIKPGLNRNEASVLILALPPKIEQQRIVTRVNELMTLCDHLKAKIQQSKQTNLHLADTVVERALG